MLLRSASSPLLHSWVPLARDTSPEQHAGAELHPQMPRARSVGPLSPSVSFSPSSASPSPRMITRALSESDLADHAPKRRPVATGGLLPSITLEEGEEERDADEESPRASPSLSRLLSSSGLEGSVMEATEYESSGRSAGTKSGLLLLDDGCSLGGVGGGKMCGGGGGGRGGGGPDGGLEFSDPNHGNDGIDAYYQRMIEANPRNPLLLGNYARFLKEVRGDGVKAQEYCERAILAEPGDAGILSLYADLLWQTTKDAHQAEGYFQRAVEAAPNDCYVLASYARFLWDAEDEEEEGRQDEQSCRPPPALNQQANPPPIAAAS